MLIGIDASRATVAQRTGTEHYSYQLIRHLVALDIRHHYRLYFNQPPATAELDAAHVEHRVIPFPRLWTHVRLSWEMLQRPPDLLFVPAHVLPLIHPRRSVVTVHDLGYLYYPEAYPASARLYLDLSTRYNVRAATLVIADSEATCRDLIRHYHVSSQKIAVVYPGLGREFRPVHESATLQRVRNRYALPAHYILYVGTVQPRKNLERLVEACAHNAALPHLVIAGRKGWLCERIFRRVEELEAADRVHFSGYVAQEDLPALLSSARCFVMPSLYEGFGLPVLEAMACGTPVVCSTAGSLPEVAGDAALLVDPLDVNALADALERVSSEESLRAELIARGFRRVECFSWERCAQEVLAALERASA